MNELGHGGSKLILNHGHSNWRLLEEDDKLSTDRPPFVIPSKARDLLFPGYPMQSCRFLVAFVPRNDKGIGRGPLSMFLQSSQSALE